MRAKAFVQERSLCLVLAAVLAACGHKETPGGSQTAAPPPTEVPRDPGLLAGTGADVYYKLAARIGAESSLNAPRAIAVDSRGEIYVADTGNARVVVFGPDGRKLRELGKTGSGTDVLQRLSAVAIGRGDRAHVLDPGTGTVHLFEGEKALKPVGKAGFYEPGGLAVQPDGTIVVADTGGNRIVRLSPEGAPVGDPIRTAGNEDIPQPTDVSSDAEGGLHVHVPLGGKDKRGALLNFAADGRFLSKWTTVTVPSTVDAPRTTVGPDGRIYLTDVTSSRVLIYSKDGKTVSAIKIEGLTEPIGRLGGIAIDGKGRLFLTDSTANVVLRLEPAG